MTQPIPGPGLPLRRQAGSLDTQNQQPTVQHNTLGPDRSPSSNVSAVSSFFPDDIPVLRWARSGVSIIQFLGDEIDSFDCDAGELDGVARDTAIH